MRRRLSGSFDNEAFMKRISSVFALLVAMAAGVSCADEPRVKNVIYLIGDGMGLGAVSSAVLADDEPTGFEMNPVIGLSETASANTYVTDSPAGGTALACGRRTLNGYVGLDPEGVPMESILKKAQKLGKRSGIVVNTTLTEATPASFYGHVTKRSMSFDLARQFVEESGVDVAVGTGLEPFVARPDSLDLTEELVNRGYDVYLDWQSVLETESERFVGILPVNYVHRRDSSAKAAGAADGHEICFAARLAASSGTGHEDSAAEPELYLEKAVAKAVSALEDAENGFFLMVESAIIDGYGHNNDSYGMLTEMAEFDRTLKYLVDYVSRNPETLLVVVADHETGGTYIGYQSHTAGDDAPLDLSFSTRGHSGVLVPIFAYGPGAENFGRIMKNYEIPLAIETLMSAR